LDSPLGGLNLTGPFLSSEDIEFPLKGNKWNLFLINKKVFNKIAWI
jgi:hypothetical protein